MESNELKEKRKFEIKTYCQTWFWQEPEKNELLTRLLNKIYDLEDEIKLLKQQK